MDRQAGVADVDRVDSLVYHCVGKMLAKLTEMPLGLWCKLWRSIPLRCGAAEFFGWLDVDSGASLGVDCPWADIAVVVM